MSKQCPSCNYYKGESQSSVLVALILIFFFSLIAYMVANLLVGSGFTGININAWVALAFVFAFILNGIRSTYKCTNCGYEWTVWHILGTCSLVVALIVLVAIFGIGMILARSAP